MGTCEATKNGYLYFSLYFPRMFATNRRRRNFLWHGFGCYGNGKSKRFAKIIAGQGNGEISLMTSIVIDTYIYARETFGRNSAPR
jgi:hypothetical protein